MGNTEQVQLFEGLKVRTVWDDVQEKWYFSVVDVVRVLTDSDDPKQYIKKMRTRDPELNSRWGTICTPTEMMASDGKIYKSQAATMDGIFRIIQSIPSKKAEPFKQWMAQVAAQRIDQMIDPELGIQQALADYKRQGRSDEWINQRLKSIEVRKDLTDQWKAHNVAEGTGYAALTDIIYQAWAGLTAREYKHLKGLTKENLRDNMTNEELVINMLAELTATNITKSEHPLTMSEHTQVAERGGSVARVAKEAFEQQTGKKVVSDMNAKRQLESRQPQLPLKDDE